VAAAPALRHGPASWFSRLSDEHRQELLGIRRDFRAGLIPSSARGLARTIVEHYQAAGLPICGLDGVRMWLAD